MLREQLHTVVELECEVLEEEARVRRVEREDNRLVVRRLNRLDVLLHVPAVGQLLVVLEQVEGERHVIGSEGLAVAPLGLLADIDRDRGVVLSVGVAGREPGDHVVSESGVIEKGLPHGSIALLVRRSGSIRVPNPHVGVLATRPTIEIDQRAITRHIGMSRCSTSLARVEETKGARNRGRTRSTAETQDSLASLLEFH